MPTEQKKVNAQKARVARAMEPHYEAFGVLKNSTRWVAQNLGQGSL